MSATLSVWSQDKWRGQFGVRWIYVKDVPNSALRHIRLENNENKPVTNSRDTQEVLPDKGKMVLKIMHTYRHATSIFDDFSHYEKRQAEEDQRKSSSSSATTAGGGGGVSPGGGGSSSGDGGMRGPHHYDNNNGGYGSRSGGGQQQRSSDGGRDGGRDGARDGGRDGRDGGYRDQPSRGGGGHHYSSSSSAGGGGAGGDRERGERGGQVSFVCWIFYFLFLKQSCPFEHIVNGIYLSMHLNKDRDGYSINNRSTGAAGGAGRSSGGGGGGWDRADSRDQRGGRGGRDGGGMGRNGGGGFNNEYNNSEGNSSSRGAALVSLRHDDGLMMPGAFIFVLYCRCGTIIS